MRVLRILSVNDVYVLDNLPRLKSLVLHHRRANPDDALIVVLAGDFLAPSLLSSIDAGRGMVDCMNDVGVTHVVLGNHEDDVSGEELRRRLRELTAVCIGTNVRSGLDLPRHVVLDVGGSQVGLIGLVMDDPAVYRGPPFGGVELAHPNDAALEETALLLRAGCRAVVPITHQPFDDDRALALAQRSPPFPVIVGGHEHVPILENVEGTWIVKSGSEATHAVVTEIAFPEGEASAPVVTVRREAVAPYPEDEGLRARVDRHMARVRELATATLLRLSPGEELSSVGVRSRQTSMGTLVCSRLRDALAADACVFNGGGIRGGHDYDQWLTYGDVEAEVPFDNEIIVVRMPGRVVREAVAFSRAKAPAESGAFLQVDDRTVVDEDHVVVAIDGAPLDPDRDYGVAIVRELLFGLDHVEPLVRWASDNPGLVPPPGSGREPKMLLVQAFAVAIWEELGGFDALDTDGDERVTPAEIAAAVARARPAQAPSDVLADVVLRALDADGDRVITREEAASARKATRRSPAPLDPLERADGGGEE